MLGYFAAVEFCVPVVGSKISFPACPEVFRSNILLISPALTSKDWFPIRPNPQLSSIKRRIDDRSVMLWSTKFTFAYGEITSRGIRGPYPQRSCAAPVGAWPQLVGVVFAVFTPFVELVIVLVAAVCWCRWTADQQNRCNEYDCQKYAYSNSRGH